MRCDNCDKTIKLDDSFTGKSIRCPRCKEAVRIRGRRPPEDEDDGRPAKKRGGGRKAKSSSAPLWIGLAIGGVALLLIAVGTVTVLVIATKGRGTKPDEQRGGEFAGKKPGPNPGDQGGGELVPVKPGEKPTPPLKLEKPPAPASVANGRDLSKMSWAELRRVAADAEHRGDYVTAVPFQHWAIQKGLDGGQYDMACYYSRIANVAASLYWLQRAGLEEGVDPKWAGEDSDLELVRRDSRWPVLSKYLFQCADYWEKNGQPATVLILPKNYVKGQPITLLVGLHGLGHNPAGFMEGYQTDADDLNIAFVGVSGTLPRGKTRFAWSQEHARNAARLDAAFKEIADRVTVQPGNVILFGFSQGAQVAAELAIRDPKKYAGAIVLSPGGLPDPDASVFVPGKMRQGYVLAVGAREHPGNVRLTAEYARLCRTAGAQVRHKEYPGVAQHNLPPDFLDVLPDWIDFILAARKR